MAAEAENVVDLLLAQHEEQEYQGVGSPAKHVAVGPVAAVADRVRDAIGKVRG